MNSELPLSRLSALVHAVRIKAAEGPITFSDLLTIFGARGHSFLILFLVIPFAQPIPLVGLSTPFGLLIALAGLFMFLDRPPRVPRRWSRREISSPTLLRICTGLESLLRKTERFIRPRGRFLCEHPGLHRLNGLVVIVNALLLSLPLPVPFSNFLPAWTLLLLSVGSLEEDGVVMSLAYLAGLFTLLFFAGLVWLPAVGISLLR